LSVSDSDLEISVLDDYQKNIANLAGTKQAAGCPPEGPGHGKNWEGLAMVIYVAESGPDRAELTEALIKEGVTYQECPARAKTELDVSTYKMVEIQANLPEVKVPPTYTQGDGDMRAWRLPSGRLIISDMEGNLEQIAPPLP
jgi:hypothetical protein